MREERAAAEQTARRLQAEEMQRSFLEDLEGQEEEIDGYWDERLGWSGGEVYGAPVGDIDVARIEISKEMPPALWAAANGLVDLEDIDETYERGRQGRALNEAIRSHDLNILDDDLGPGDSDSDSEDKESG